MTNGDYSIHLFDGHTIWTPSQKLWAIAIQENRPIGMASLCRVAGDETLWISDLRVEGDCLRRGIGRALVDKLERIAKDRGALQVAAGVDVNNIPSLALFRGRGYLEFDRSPREEVIVAWLSRAIRGSHET
jgi:ribosomal protein S18 acetylase RimI-like enzyme